MLDSLLQESYGVIDFKYHLNSNRYVPFFTNKGFCPFIFCFIIYFIDPGCSSDVFWKSHIWKWIVDRVKKLYCLYCLYQNSRSHKKVIRILQGLRVRPGRCKNKTFWKIYFPQMKLGACHKNKIVLEKEKKIKNAPIFAKMHLNKSAAPLKVKI